MEIRKLILAVFIVFALSFSYQPANIYSKEREAIVLISDYKKDCLTYDFIKKNETKKIAISVSLTFQCMFYAEKIFFNTS